MSKFDFIKLIKEREKQGYLSAPSMLLEIFNDTENIPDEYISLFSYKPEPIKPIQLFCGAKMINHFEKVCSNYVDKLGIILD
jgi:hypothetical protein